MSDTATTTSTAPVTGSTEPAATSGEPDFANMTGEQAKAWVEAQKARDAAKGEKPRQADGKFASTKESQSSPVADAAKEAAAKRKLKIDNEEVDEDEVLKIYRERKGHQQAANKILQEGKAARKQAEEFISMMRDPQKFFDVASKLGHTPRELAEKYLAAQLQDELMDPRERELRDAKAKLKQIEEMEAMQREQAEQQKINFLKDKYAKDYNDQFVKALQESQLPATKEMVAHMAKYIYRAAKLKYEMTPSEAAKLVQEDIQTSYRKLVGSTDGDMLLKLLGDDVANKIRKYDSEKLRNPNKNLFTPEDQGEVTRERRNSNGKRMSTKEWREFNRKN